MCDLWLIGIAIAAAVVDRAEHGGRVVMIHERARTVVDRLTGYRHVVGVHHAVDETDMHPVGDEGCLPDRDALKHCKIWSDVILQLRIMARDHVVRQALNLVQFATRGKVLESTDPDVTRGNTCEYSSRQCGLPIDGFAGGHGRKSPSRRDTERVHRLTNQIFPKHRTESGQAIAGPRKRRASRAFELNITAPAMDVDDLAQKQRPTIAELWNEVAELVTGIGLCQRRGSLR